MIKRAIGSILYRINTVMGFPTLDFDLHEAYGFLSRGPDPRLGPVDIVDRIDELVNESLERGKVQQR